MNEKTLPVLGGNENNGNITQNAALIEESKRVLPMGYWGSFKKEVGLSQIMIAIDPSKASMIEEIDQIADKILKDIACKKVAVGFERIYCPGELELCTRKENMVKGIPILEEVWNKLIAL